ncbi:MAG: T9SS type A sorting domain-containing protein [Bacteroidota bacterium]
MKKIYKLNYTKPILLVTVFLMFLLNVKAQTTNIAPLATALASTCNTGACATLNDLNFGTCGTQQMWITSGATNPGATVFIQFTWTSPQRINKITINAGESGNRFLGGGTIQIWDGSTWVNHQTFVQGTFACSYDINFPAITTTQLRIIDIVVTGTQSSNVNFREIEIWTAPPTGFNDAGVVSIDSPSVFSAGNRNVKATIRNFGVNAINTVNVNWSVNGVLQTPINYSSTLDTANGAGPNTAQVTLGTVTLASNVLYNFKAWTSQPNSVADTVNVNDTAISSLRSPLAGNYTIGATGDFATLTLAANTLNSAGVNGPVNFSFIDNEYNRNTGEVFPITLNSFVGMSPSNPISFRPALGVNPNISDSNALALIIFNGARYVNFIGTNLTNSTNRGMVIQNRSLNTSSNVFILRNEARGINISNINFRSGNPSNIGGSAPAMVFIGGTTNLLGIGNDSNTIKHNTFSPVYNGTVGARYGKGIVVSGQSAVLQNDNITIDSNYFYGYNHVAIYITETNSGNGANFNIRGNSIFDTATAVISTNNIYGIWFNPSNVNSINNRITGNFLGGSSPFNGGTGPGLPKQLFTHTGFWYYYGIFSNASVTGLTTIANNTIRNMQFNTGSTGYFQGIYSGSGMLDILNNTVGHPSDTNNMVFNGGGGNVCTGFSGIYSFSTGITNIKNNVISSFTSTELNSNTIFGIYSAGNNSANINIDSNTVSRMITRTNNPNTTTCGAFIGIFSQNSSPNVQIRGNIIGGNNAADSISLISPTPSGTRAMGIYVTGGINTILNNRIQHFYTNSNGTFGLTQAALGGIYLQSATNGQIMNNNWISDFRNYGLQGVSVYGLASVSGAATINNNTVRDFFITSNNANTLTNASINGIVLSTSNIHTVNNNTITNLINLPTSTAAGTQINGIFAGVNNQATISGNNINRLVFNGPGAGSVFGINTSTSAANQIINQNTITHLISADTTNNNQTLVGISYTASNVIAGNISSLSRNNIHSFNHAYPTGFSPTGSIQYGLQIQSGTATVSNNLIRIGRDSLGVLLQKAGNYRGILVQSTQGQLRVYHNNVLTDVNPNYGGINTAALEITGTPNASIFAFTDVRNNILVNNATNSGTASGNHYNVMYPTSMFQLLNGVNVYTIRADFNLYHNALSGNSFVGRFNFTNYTDLNSLRRAAPINNLFIQESSSGFINPNFVDGTGAATSVDLRLQTSNPAEGMGDTTIAAFVLDDINGNNRTGRADIGAHSGTFTLTTDAINPAIYYTNLSNSGSTSNRTFQATIYDAGLIGTGSDIPRVYFRKNQGTWASTAGTLASGTTSNGVYDFTIDNSLVGGITLGDSIYYYVIAQDVAAGNINSKEPYVTATNVNTVSSPPAVAASYIYNDPIATTVYVGTGSGSPAYPSLTGTGGLFAAINNSTLTGNTEVLIQGSTTENGLNQLNKWLESGAGNYTLTIRPAPGAGQVLVSGTSTTTLGLIRLAGTDRVNILGWSPSGTSADTNLIIRCTTTGTPAIAFINGGSNDTVRNVILESRNTLTAGVNAGTINLSPTTTTRGLSNLSFINNYIRTDLTSTLFPAVGIYGQGTTPRLNTNIAITGNHFINFTSNGVQLTTGSGDGNVITGNHFYYNYGPIFTSTATLNPILINASTTTNDNVIANNWIGGSAPFAAGTPWTMNGALSFTGINLNTGLTTGTTVNRNVIQNITFSSTTNTNVMTGILVAGTASIYNITNNRIGSLTQSNGIFSVANQRVTGIQSTATGNVIITGDTVSNIFVLNTGTIAGIWGINVLSGASNTTNISNNFVNTLITSAGNSGTITAAAVVGIMLQSTSLSQTIANNTVRTLVNQTAATHSMYGILVSSGSNVINNNTVYGLNSRSTYTGTTTIMALSGIHCFASVTGAQTITNNTVDSVWLWTATPTTTQTSGISVFNTFGQLTLTDNTVKNINSNTSSVNTQTLAGLSGILISCPSAINNNISRNNVSVINHNHTTGGVHVIGMLVSTSASLVGNNSNITRNFIHSMRSNSTASPILTGLTNINGFATYANNMVRMGIDSGANVYTNANTQRGIWHQTSTQSNYYHNSVLVAGNPATGSLNTSAFEVSPFQITAGQTLNLRNNIFSNIASNSGTASGFHFGVRFQDSLRINSDYNIFNTPGTNGFVGGMIATNSRYALLGGDSNSWKSRVRLDITSAQINPNYDLASLSVADVATLALNANNPAEKSGDASITVITDDFFGNVRSNNTPSDIGAHAGNFSQTPDAFPPTISFTPFTNAGSISGTRTLVGVTFTDNNGIVNSGINRPRIYYTKDRITWYSNGAINMSGTATNATADFVIDYFQFSPALTINDSIIYFVVAQDNAGNVQSSAPLAVGTSVNNITQYPLVSNQYKFLPVIPANTVLSVGIGQPYTSLSGVGGLFEFLNSRTLGGNISAEITSNLTEPGTIALNQMAEDGVGAGTFSVTIRPNAGTTSPRLITGSGARIIALNGANRVKINGIPTGGTNTQRMLQIRNTNTSGVNILVNSATGVLVNNTIIENGNTSTANAGIEFRVGTGTLATVPCSFDTLNNNIITNNTTAVLPAGIPQNGIYMIGNANVYHNNIVVSNNEISNFMANGYFMAGNGGDGFRVTNNHFYYNLPIYTNTSGIHTAINMLSGSFSSGNVISGNFIGGSAANASGNAWAVNQPVGFNGISTSVGNNANTLIQSNTIQNINYSNQTGFNQFIAIRGQAGNTLIGGSTLLGNQIGHPTITNSIVFRQQTLHTGILYFGTNSISIIGNRVQGIFIDAPALSAQIYGIDVQQGTLLGLNNNLVGSTTVAGSITNNSNSQTYGIIVRVSAQASPTLTVDGNTVANLFASGTQPTVLTYGIFLNASVSGNPTVTNNIITNLSTNSTNITTIGGAAVGLLCNVAAGSVPLFRNNTISAIRCLNTGSAATMATGLALSTGQNANMSGNRIFDITNASTSTSTISPVPVVNGIQIVGGNINNTVINNQITLGTGQTTNTQFNGIIVFTSNSGITMNLFNNSVLIEGAASSGNQNSYAFVRGNNTGTEMTTWLNLRNNVFANRRTGGSGSHFAIANQTVSPTNNFWNSSSSAYNLLVSANANTIGQWGFSNNTISQWRANATSDELSYAIQSGTGAGQLNLTNLFTNPAIGNLGIQTNNAEAWYVFGKGIAGSAVNNLNSDFNNASRGTTLGLGLTLGSVQINTAPSIAPPAATASAAPAANTTTNYVFANRNVASIAWGTSAPTSVSLLNYTGVNAIGTAPAGNNLNQYNRIDVSGGTAPYNYSATINYDPALLGNVTAVNNLKVSNNTGGTLLLPTYTTQVNNSVNTTLRTITSNGLTSVTSVGAIYLTGTENAAPPTVLSFTPNAREIGGNVSIRGSLFTGASALSFNGTPQTVYTVVNDTLITTTVPVGATSGTVAVTNVYGTGTSTANFTVIPVPTLTALSSSIGTRGTSVTITGTGFTWATQVQFNGVTAVFTIVNNTTITTTVPLTATTGSVTVTSPAGVAPSSGVYTVVLAPTVTSFTPSSGPASSTVSISGTNFQFVTNVRFNGLDAVYTVNSSTLITAIVPNAATTGAISVVNGSGTGTSGTNFTVIQLPTITGFTPTSGGVGTVVAITGTNFTGATVVRFNTTNASTFTVVNAGLINATVPSGATTGIITVITPAGTDFTTNNFTVIGDLTVSTTQTISGTYNNVTVTGTGNATLGGVLTALGTVTIQTGGQINFGTDSINGPANFVSQTRSKLFVGAASGITSTGGFVGNIQVGGLRNINSGTIITYNGNVPQVTGNGLPVSTDSLIINNANGVVLSQATTINNNLALGNGNLILGNVNLTVNGTITGASSFGYIVTNNTPSLSGSLTRAVANNSTAVTFPVGTSLSYTPAQVTLTNTSTADAFSVRVFNGVLANGISGAAITNNVVNRTWLITEGVTGGSNATVNLTWDDSLQTSGFNRFLCGVARHNSLSWIAPATYGTATGTNPYSRSLSGITSFVGPFSVGDNSGTLPVELTSFTAKANGKDAILSWVTSSEINNSHFEVERSMDGKTFEYAGKVVGAGNSNNMNKYRFIDENIAATVSTVYYRLKQVDFDGAVNYHGNVQVKFDKETVATLNMEAYPNPFNGNLNIVLTGVNAGKVDLVMMDIQGKIVKTITNEILNSSYLIELNETSTLTDGLYIIQAIVNGEVIKLKVVKTSN